MVDDALLDLRSNTDLSLQIYGEGADPENENREVLMELVNGTVSTLTGSLGKDDPEAYQLRTTNASIGIRGTNFDAQSLPDDNTSFTAVNDGTIALRSGDSELLVGPDQAFRYAQAQGDNPPQGRLDPPPSLTQALEEELPAEEEEEGEEQEGEGDEESGEEASSEEESSEEGAENGEGEGTDGEQGEGEGQGGDGDNAADNASETAQENANENSAVANASEDDGESPGNSGSTPAAAGVASGASGNSPGGGGGTSSGLSEDDDVRQGGFSSAFIGPSGTGNNTAGSAAAATTSGPSLPFEDTEDDDNSPFDDDFPGQGQGTGGGSGSNGDSDEPDTGPGDGGAGDGSPGQGQGPGNGQGQGPGNGVDSGDGDADNGDVPDTATDIRFEAVNAESPSSIPNASMHVVASDSSDVPLSGYALDSTLDQPQVFEELEQFDPNNPPDEWTEEELNSVLEYFANFAYPPLALFEDNKNSFDGTEIPDQIAEFDIDYEETLPDRWVWALGEFTSGALQNADNAVAGWSYWNAPTQSVSLFGDQSDASQVGSPDSTWYLQGVVDTDFEFCNTIEFSASLSSGPGFLGASSGGVRYSEANGDSGAFNMTVTPGGNVSAATLQLNGETLPSWDMKAVSGAQFSNGRLSMDLEHNGSGRPNVSGSMKGFIGDEELGTTYMGAFNLENSGNANKAEGVVAAPGSSVPD